MHVTSIASLLIFALAAGFILRAFILLLQPPPKWQGSRDVNKSVTVFKRGVVEAYKQPVAFHARALGHAEFVGDHFASGARNRLLLV